ncbi:MAG: hypothetical protein Fur0018_18720 [Anaerolineales bacterium]
MPDGGVPGQRLHVLLLKDLRHQADALVQAQMLAVAGGDAGGFLSAVLQGEQAEEDLPGDVLIGGGDAENATHE